MPSLPHCTLLGCGGSAVRKHWLDNGQRLRSNWAVPQGSRGLR